MVGIELVLTRGVLKVFLFEKMKIRNGLLPHFYGQYMAMFLNSTTAGLERHLKLAFNAYQYITHYRRLIGVDSQIVGNFMPGWL